MQPKGQVITWDAFKNKFRKAHIPSGFIKIMRDKFVGGFHIARTRVPRKGHKESNAGGCMCEIKRAMNHGDGRLDTPESTPHDRERHPFYLGLGPSW
jgi:hypothetical protein